MVTQKSNNRLSLVLFLILLLCYSYVNGGWGYNQYTRLDLLHALTIHGTLAIDEHQGNTGDKSKFNDHYYSDKAPGTAFLAIPAFLATTSALYLTGANLESSRAFAISHWGTSVGSVALLTALGGVAFFALLRRIVGDRFAFIAALATFLGSLPFPYAVMLFSHAEVIGLLCIALWATLIPPLSPPEQCELYRRMKRISTLLAVALLLVFCIGTTALLITSWKYDISPFSPLRRSFLLVGAVFFLCVVAFRVGVGMLEKRLSRQKGSMTPPVLLFDCIAGLSCGFAVASEYTAALAVVGIFILLTLRDYRRAVPFCLATIPPLLLIPLYNFACFGDFLSTGYDHLKGFVGMSRGFFGIVFPPRLTVLFALLVGPARGLFFWTPFFLLGGLGIYPLYKKDRALALVSICMVLGYVTAIAGYRYWSGGTALGPRHLASLIPFLGIVAAVGLVYLPKIGSAFAALSILLTGMGTIITPMLTNSNNPITQFYLPRLMRGQLTQNLGSVLGVHGIWSLVPLLLLLSIPLTVAALRFAPQWFVHKHRILPKKSSGETPPPRPPLWLTITKPALWLSLLFGLLLRVHQLPLMEFKSDESTFVLLAYRAWHQFGSVTSLPITSLPSFRLPPFFAYVTGIPLLFSQNPLAAAAFIALLNIAGILVLYFFLRKYFGQATALETSAIISSAPWAIILSRKVWNPDLIFPFLILFYVLLLSVSLHPRPWKVVVSFLAFGLLTQLHLSTWFLTLPLAIFLLIVRPRLDLRGILLGGGVFLLVYLPYILGAGFRGIPTLFSLAHAEDSARLLLWSLNLSSGLKFTYLLGGNAFLDFLGLHGPLLAQGVFWIFISVAGAAVVFFAYDTARKTLSLLRTRASLSPPTHVLLLLLLVYFCVLGGYFVLGISPFPHYFSVLFPTAALLFVLFLKKTDQWFPHHITVILTRSLVLLVVFANLIFSAAFFHYLDRWPKTIKGDYGMPYKYQSEESHQRLASHLQSISSTEERQRTYPASSASSAVRK